MGEALAQRPITKSPRNMKDCTWRNVAMPAPKSNPKSFINRTRSGTPHSSFCDRFMPRNTRLAATLDLLQLRQVRQVIPVSFLRRMDPVQRQQVRNVKDLRAGF